MNQAMRPIFSSLVGAVRAAGLYSSACSVRRDTYTQDAIGDRVVSGFTAIITDVACQFGVPTASWDHRAGFERRGAALTEVRSQRQCNLSGYYPGIATDCIATVDGADYNIISVVSDSQQSFTELLLELVTI